MMQESSLPSSNSPEAFTLRTGSMSVMAIFQQLRPVGWFLYEPSIILDHTRDFPIRSSFPNGW